MICTSSPTTVGIAKLPLCEKFEPGTASPLFGPPAQFEPPRSLIPPLTAEEAFELDGAATSASAVSGGAGGSSSSDGGSSGGGETLLKEDNSAAVGLLNKLFGADGSPTQTGNNYEVLRSLAKAEAVELQDGDGDGAAPPISCDGSMRTTIISHRDALEAIGAHSSAPRAEQMHQEGASWQQPEQNLRSVDRDDSQSVTYLSENGALKTTVISRGYALVPIVAASAVPPVGAGCCPRGRLKCLVCKKCCRGCCKCTVGEVDTPAALAWTCL